MQIIKIILIIFLAVLISATLGFASIADSISKTYKNPDSEKQSSPGGPVDFMSSDEYLSIFKDISRPGDSLYLKLRVYNNSPDNGNCGGSTVRFLLNGETVDEVPFYLADGDTFKDISARLFLPEGPYLSLNGKQSAEAEVQAIIDPYNITAESNEGNNTAQSQFIIKGNDEIELAGINQATTIDVTGISAWSVKNDAPGNKISAAIPGEKLNLKAKLKFNPDANGNGIRAKFILNGVAIKEFFKKVTGNPSSGYIDFSGEYYVPVNANQPYEFRVVLDNGSHASITLPIIRWDVGINESDMYWSGQDYAIPGKNIYLKANAKNITHLKFPFDTSRIAYWVLIDGEIFYEGAYFLSNEENNLFIPAYKVPAGRTVPLQYTIILDPYGQLKESDEINNTATIAIPVQNTGTTGPDFSVSSDGLSYISKPVLPGAELKLSAAILNNSSSYLSKDLRIQFKINGSVISDFKINKSFIKPLQHYVATKTWNSPVNLPGGSTFEVVLDPAKEFTGEDISDNVASIVMDVYGADLEITADCLSWLPKEPQAGSTVTLYSGIKNIGLSNTPMSCKANFFIDDNSVGQTDVPAINGVSGYVASLIWQIPPATELAPLEWNTLEGSPGKLPIPGATKDYLFKVEADWDNQINEANESNNIAVKNLTVYVPYTKAIVYARVYDVVGSISGAEVEIRTADGKTVKTVSDDYGWCTFTGVPFGNYTLTVKKDKYEDFSRNLVTQNGRLTNYNEIEITRDEEFPYFSATASPMEGVTALKTDFNAQVLDPRITDERFNFEWWDGAALIGEGKSLSFVFVEPGIHEVTFYIKNLNYDIVASKTFSINVLAPQITLSDGGRQLQSTADFFLDTDFIFIYDIDKDGLNQAVEDALMSAVNPKFELDEEEDWLKGEYNSIDKVINFVRVTPYPDYYDPEYVLIYYAVSWSRDYGRFGLQWHNGDVEKVVMAWKIIDDKNLELKCVFTSAHGEEATGHSAAWAAVGETCNTGKVVGGFDDNMCAELEFDNNILKLQVSEDKHAIYPTAVVGNDVVLVAVSPIPGVGVVGEDCGGGGIQRLECYNAGEPEVPVMDDIGWLFENERIWSGNIEHPGSFCGGLEYTDYTIDYIVKDENVTSPSTIGGSLETLPNKLLTLMQSIESQEE